MPISGKFDYTQLALGAPLKAIPSDGKALVFKDDGIYWDDVDPKVKPYQLGKSYERGDLLTDDYNNIFVVKNPFTATRPLDNEIANDNVRIVTYDVDLVYKTIYLSNINIGDTYTIVLNNPNPNANRDITVLKEISMDSTTLNPFTFDQNDINWSYDSTFVLFDENGAGLKTSFEKLITYVNNIAILDANELVPAKNNMYTFYG